VEEVEALEAVEANGRSGRKEGMEERKEWRKGEPEAATHAGPRESNNSRGGEVTKGRVSSLNSYRRSELR
jgi:hypothetical protein